MTSFVLRVHMINSERARLRVASFNELVRLISLFPEYCFNMASKYTLDLYKFLLFNSNF